MTGQWQDRPGACDDPHQSSDRTTTGDPQVRVTVGERTATGTAIDLPQTVDVDRLARAIRGETTDGIAVDAPDPGPVHEYVGVVERPSVPLRTALAAAARSRGETAPEDETITECERRLASLDPPNVDANAARKRVAEYSEEESRLHEQVAQLRGRVQTLRERDADEVLAETEARLDDAVAALTEARTERIAAEQALERARERARDARETRERRLELEDEIGNLQRSARNHLSDAVFDDFCAALGVVPSGESTGPSHLDGPGDYDGDGTTAALAIARIAALDAPIVLACGRFDDAAAAAETLAAPVVRVAQE